MTSVEKRESLKTHVIDFLSPYIGIQMTGCLYHDVTTVDLLTTNKSGIDIIGLQLELKFANEGPLFFSWTNIPGWATYSITVSKESFCTECETFTTEDDNWKSVIGHKLERFEVYGYSDANYEPHLLILEFSFGNKLGIANFYYEEDFIPKWAIGDDIWIIFGTTNLNTCIQALNLERIDDTSCN